MGSARFLGSLRSIRRQHGRIEGSHKGCLVSSTVERRRQSPRSRCRPGRPCESSGEPGLCGRWNRRNARIAMGCNSGAAFRTGAPLDRNRSEVKASTYDLCIAEGVLEHVPPGDYEIFLESCYRALKPGGWLVILIPNPLTGPHDCSRYFSAPGEPATGGHFNERTMKHLKADFRRTGFRTLKTTIFPTLFSGRKGMGWSK